MAPPVIRSATVGIEQTGTDVASPLKPPGLVVDDYLLAWQGCDADGVLDEMTAAGFVELDQQAGSPTNNYPAAKLWGKVADAADVAATAFDFGGGDPVGVSTTSGCVVVLMAIQAGTYDPLNPATLSSFTVQPRTSSAVETAPSVTGAVDQLLLALFASDTNNLAQTYPTSGPTGMTLVGQGQSPGRYALVGAYRQALTSAGATGAKSVTPTLNAGGTSTVNGWVATSVLVNPPSTILKTGADSATLTQSASVATTIQQTGTDAATLSEAVTGRTVSTVDTATETDAASQSTLLAQPISASDSATLVEGNGALLRTQGSATAQHLGVGGIPAPAPGPGVTLGAGSPTATLVITTPGIWDGQGKTVRRIDIAADDVTVQNYYTRGGTNNGIYSFGKRNKIQNCDIAEVTSDGDVNAITFFGDDTHILYNRCDKLLLGNASGAHIDFVQTWNTPSKQSSSRVIIRGNWVNGPLPPDPAYIHQGAMAQGKRVTDGGGGGTGESRDWIIEGNYFRTGGFQAIKLDDIQGAIISRNQFDGACNRVVDVTALSSGVVFYGDNIITGTYGQIGLAVTPGSPPATDPGVVDLLVLTDRAYATPHGPIGEVLVSGPDIASVAHLVEVDASVLEVETDRPFVGQTAPGTSEVELTGPDLVVGKGGEATTVRGLPPVYTPLPWRLLAQRILTGEWMSWELPITDPEIEWTLSGTTTISGSFKPEIREVADLGLEPWGTWIHLEEDGVIRGSAIMQPTSIQPDGTLGITAIGTHGYALRVPYRDRLSLVQVDPADVVRMLWAHIQGFPRGNLGVQVLGSTPIRIGTEARDVEFVTGEGEVVSFVAGPYTLNYWENTIIGSEVESLAKETPFDFTEWSGWSDASRTHVAHRIHLDYPQRGTRRFDLRFTEDENVVEKAAIEEPGDAYADTVYVAGKGEGPDQVSGSASYWVGNRLRLPAILDDKTIDNGTRANKLATEELAARLSALVEVPEIVIDSRHRNAPIGSFAPGDDIRPRLSYPYGANVAQWHRVTNVRYMPTRNRAIVGLTRQGEYRG